MRYLKCSLLTFSFQLSASINKASTAYNRYAIHMSAAHVCKVLSLYLLRRCTHTHRHTQTLTHAHIYTCTLEAGREREF